MEQTDQVVEKEKAIRETVKNYREHADKHKDARIRGIVDPKYLLMEEKNHEIEGQIADIIIALCDNSQILTAAIFTDLLLFIYNKEESRLISTALTFEMFRSGMMDALINETNPDFQKPVGHC